MFYGKIPAKEFYKKYGGQHRKIATPKHYPYIYLIYTEEKNKYDNLDITGNGRHERVHFASEGKGYNRLGNKAVMEHKSRKGVYNSLLLFKQEEGMIEYIGEYSLLNTHRDDLDGRILYFELIKVNDLDDTFIYYVDEELEERQENDNTLLVKHRLAPIDKRENYFTTNMSEFVEIMHEFTRPVRNEDNQYSSYEGLYVDERFNFISNNMHTNENSSPEEKKIAQHLSILESYNKKLRSKMRKHEKARREKIEIENQYTASDSFLYCVNVGCALAIFLVLNNKNKQRKDLWCFDLGSDIRKGRYYEKNIDTCLEHIRTKHFQDIATISDLRAEKFFLSHPHVDHFNQALEKKLLVDSEIWINSYIHTSSATYVNFLKEVIGKCKRAVEPVLKNSSDVIKIHHPDDPIELATKAPCKYSTSNANNVSPILEVKIGERSLLFTGDIGKQGWGWYENSVGKTFNEISVFFHSHHGSNNGFITNIPNKDDTEYETVNSDVYFLSSRDGAYSSIISGTMKSHHSFYKTKSTDKDSLAFYEVDLNTMVLKEYP